MRSLGVKGRRGVTTVVLGLMATPAVAQYAPQTQVYPAAQPGYYYQGYPQGQPAAQQPPVQQPVQQQVAQQPTAPPAVSQTQVGQPSYPRYQQVPPTAGTYPATQPTTPYVAQHPTYPPTATYPQPSTYPQQGAYSTTTAPVPGSTPQQSAYPRTAMQPRYAMQEEPPVPPVPQPAEPIPAPAQGPDNHDHGALGAHGDPSYAPGVIPYAGGPVPHHAGQGVSHGSYIGAGDCNCNNMQAWNTYMQPYAHGQACAEGGPGACEVPPSRQWFFGAYALYMQRDRPSYQRIAVVPGMPYETVLSTQDLDNDFTWGAEIRFGSTFGRSYDACNPCAQRPYAWEIVYWGLTDDEQSAMYTAMPGAMSGINYAGLEYDIDSDGMVDGNVNDYFAYYDPDNPMPNGYDSTVRVRNSFKAQNLELNFLRLPLYGGCEPCSPITVSTVFGVRYLKLDEEFQHSVMFDDGMVSGTLYHDIEVDNQLVGFQIGGNMNWAIACKWDVFCDSMMGVYNNRIDVYQRVYGADGDVTFTDDGMPASVRGRKDDIAFLGEMRWGLGYQVSCNCRLTAAYRVMAMTGVALAGEQIPDNWSDSMHVRWIDSNDSLVLHGLQLGAEFKY
jgi:hypothetical protein